MKQICHGGYCSLKKWLKLSLKTYFSGHFERFFVYTLMYPITAKFFTYKDLIEVRNCGKLRQYSICGCQVTNFHPWIVSFCFVLDPYSPKFSQEVIFMQIKTVFYKPFKNLRFHWNMTYPQFTPLVHFLG